MKGQGSVELMILMGFMLVAMSSFFLVIDTRLQAQQSIRQDDLKVQLGDLIEQEVILASKVQIGYMRSFELPPNLGNEGYNISLEDDNLLIIIGNRSENEYFRFLNVEVSMQPSAPGQVLVPDSREIILERTGTGVLIRKDCVQAGHSLLSCPTS